MFSKYYSLTIMTLIICLTIIIVSVTYRNGVVSLEASKTGLEQCVYKGQTIWVKDCKSLVNKD